VTLRRWRNAPGPASPPPSDPRDLLPLGRFRQVQLVEGPFALGGTDRDDFRVRIRGHWHVRSGVHYRRAADLQRHDAHAGALAHARLLERLADQILRHRAPEYVQALGDHYHIVLLEEVEHRIRAHGSIGHDE